MLTQPNLGTLFTQKTPTKKMPIEELFKELQLIIWDFAVENQKPQSITLGRVPIPNFENPSFTTITTNTYQTAHEEGLPAVLAASHLSRHQALKCYEFAFEGVDGRPKFINWSKDSLTTHFEVIFALDRIETFHSLPSVLDDCNKVQNLIMNASPDYGWDDWPRIVSNHFEDLKIITVRQWIYGTADFETQADQFDDVWEKYVNPRRIAKGKLPNPTPMVFFERLDDYQPFHEYDDN